MELPKCAGTRSIHVDLEAGKQYLWCTCGLSKSQPFCDGSHKSTPFKPMAFKVPESKLYKLCPCKQTKSKPFCDGAHKKLPDYMILAASGIILRDKKILLIKRSNYTEIYPKHWACPGGRAERGETAEQNVIREVKEEVNLDFTPSEILTTATWQDRYLYRFLGQWIGEVKLQEEEVTDYDWFTFDEAKKLKLAFDYPKVIDLVHLKGLLK